MVPIALASARARIGAIVFAGFFGLMAMSDPSPALAQTRSIPLIAIDPGHGADDWGASGTVGKRQIVEKEITLTVAKQLADILKNSGYRVLLTRNEDSAVNKSGADINKDGKVDLADELQQRVDKVNEAGATVFVSIHFNGSTEKSLRGTEIYYSASRPFASENRKLANAMMMSVQSRLGEAGATVNPRGVMRDTAVGGHLFVIGPVSGRIERATLMPGVLIEGLFLTNPEDAALIADPTTLQALARGYADGIAAYVGPPPKPLPKNGVISGEDGAFLRPSPLIGTLPLTLLPAGTTVDIAEATRGDEVNGSDEWWRVSVRGQAGFIFSRLIEAAAPIVSPTKPATITGTVTVLADDGRAARLREAPSLNADIVARAAPGEELVVIDQADGEAADGKVTRWFKVRRGEGIGWVWSPLVSKN